MIDVGGAALLCAAARNYAGVAAVAEPGALRARSSRRSATAGSVSAELRQRLAAEAFGDRRRVPRRDRRLPQPGHRDHASRRTWRWSWRRSRDLRYGENPHQRAAFYRETTHRDGTLADATQLQGARALVQRPARPRRRLPDRRRLHAPRRSRSSSTPTRSGWPPTTSSSEAYRQALETDPVAAFGGIVGVNRELDGATAREIAANSYEAVVAPGYRRGGARDPAAASPASRCFAVPPNPAEGLRDYGIAEPRLQARRRRAARRDAGRARPRPRPAAGGDPAPARRSRS